MKDTYATRDRIVRAADQLFYQQGFQHTSFTHIAEAVSISRGNFYHHFKSKDEILDAVISLRLTDTNQMLARWQIKGATPADRIRSFIYMLITNRKKIERHGCPVGTLCIELAKLNHAARSDANKLFSLFRAWLRRQFELLGQKSKADELAMHVLAWSQGVAMLANAFQDETFIHREVDEICGWLEAQIESSGSAPLAGEC